MSQYSLPPTGRILLIEPMTSAAKIIDDAHELGLETVVASFDSGDRRLPDRVRGRVGEIAVVDPNDEEALLERVLKLHIERPIGAVIPGVEFYVATAARVASVLGLPGHPAHMAPALRDKSLMRQKVQAAGLRVPRWAVARSRAELAAAAESVGFPAVLKPVSSAGSIHVRRVEDMAGAQIAYDAMLGDTRADDVGKRLDGVVLLEEYLAGPEISVEGYVIDGRIVVLSLTKKFLSAEPFFVEIGHIVQYDAPPGVRSVVEAYVEQVCRVLGVALGSFHCELRLVDGQPVLVEIGARLAGGQLAELVEWVSGVSLTRVTLATHLGIRPELVAAIGQPRALCAGVHYVTAQSGPGTITEVQGIAEVQDLPWVRDVKMYIHPGYAMPPFGDFRSQLGHVKFVADSYEEALARRAWLESRIRIA